MALAILGCGGMGNRHLLWIKMLGESGHSQFELAGACGTRRDNAAYLAGNAEEMLGADPLQEHYALGVLVLKALGCRNPGADRGNGRGHAGLGLHL